MLCPAPALRSGKGVDVHHVRRVAALLELLGNGGHLWRHVPVAARQTADGQGQPAAWSEQRERERESSRIVEPEDQLVDVVRQAAGHDAGARGGAVHEDVGLVHLDPLLDLAAAEASSAVRQADC